MEDLTYTIHKLCHPLFFCPAAAIKAGDTNVITARTHHRVASADSTRPSTIELRNAAYFSESSTAVRHFPKALGGGALGGGPVPAGTDLSGFHQQVSADSTRPSMIDLRNAAYFSESSRAVRHFPKARRAERLAASRSQRVRSSVGFICR